MAKLIGRSASYIRNTMRSFGYATLDVLKDNSPYISSLFKESKETVSDLYHSIKDFSSGNITDVKSTGQEALGHLFKNLKDDLKSGNFYNKERDSVMDSQIASMMGFDLDFGDDFSFDEDSFSLSDSEDITDGDELIVKQNAKNTAASIIAMDKVGSKITNGVNKATINSANYIVSNSRVMNQAMMQLTSKGFGTVTEAIAQLNKTTVGMSEAIAKPLTTFMQNGTLFFGKTTEALDKIVKNTEEMLKRLPQYSTAGGTSSSRKSSLEDIMLDGGVSVSSYKEMVAANIKEVTSLVTSLTGMKSKDFKLSNLAKGVSPFRLPLKLLTETLIPVTLTGAMKTFDTALKDFIPSMLAKAMTSKESSLLGSILKGIFLPKDNFKKDVGTNYKQGPIPFDGQTKKAITDVIPTYLSHILAAINGSEVSKYDYDRGVFIKKSEIETRRNERIRDAARAGGGRLYTDSVAAASNDLVKDELETFFREAFLSGEGFTDIYKPGFATSKLGRKLSKESLRILRRLVHSGNYNRMPADMMRARASYTRNINNLTDSGTSIDTALTNRSELLSNENLKAVGEGLLTKATDKYGNSTLDYLRGIYINSTNGFGGNNGGGNPTNPILPNNSGISMPTFRSGNDANNRARRRAANRNRGRNTTGIETNPNRVREDVDTNDPAQVEAWNKAVDEEIKKLTEQIIKLKNKKNKSDRDLNNISILTEKLNKKKDERIGEAYYANIVEEASRRKTEFSQEVGEIKSKIRDTIKKIIPEPVLDFFDRPITAVADLLNNLTKSMTDFLWGDGSKDGVFDMVKKKISAAIDKNETLTHFLDNLLGPKDENGKRKGLWEATKKSLGEYWNWMKSGYSEKWDQTGASGARYMDINAPAANGRRITKSGMIAVSEGEMVIPAEFNPLYRRTINKRDQYRKEQKAMDQYARLYSGNVLGGFRGGTAYINTKYEQDDVAGYKSDDQIKQLKRGLRTKHRDAILDGIRGKYNQSGNRVKIAGSVYFRDEDGTWHTSESGSIKRGFSDTMRDTRNLVSSGIHNIAEHYNLGGKKEDLNRLLENLGPDIKAAKGRIGAGGIIGALGGGIFGAPIIGLLLGSTIGFVTKSEKAQKYLFGDIEYDKDGKPIGRTGGLFSKNASNFLTKVAPDMARGGSIGAIAGGLLIGGPIGLIGGLATGSILGFARKSTAMQEFLFGKGNPGDKDYKKGLFNRGKFQKVLPKAIIGAGLGAVFGPAGGLFTNMILGAGLGFLTENKKVHDFLFGDKDKKKPGLLYKIGDKLFGGINDLFHNTANWVKTTVFNLGKNILTKAGNITSWFRRRRARKEALNRVEKTPLRRVMETLGKVGAVGGAAVAGGLASPFLLPFLAPLGLTAAGVSLPRVIANSRQRKNARRGYNIYDYKTDKYGNYILDEKGRKVKGNLSAAERVRFRDTHKLSTKEFGKSGRWDLFDKELANIKDSKGLEDLASELDALDVSNRGITEIRNSAMEEFYNKADSSINSRDLDKLAGYIQSGDTDKAFAYLDRINFPDNETKRKYYKLIEEQAGKVSKADSEIKSKRIQFLDKYKFKGGLKDISKAQELVQNELKNVTPEQRTEEFQKKSIDFQEVLKKNTSNISDQLKEMLTNGIAMKPPKLTKEGKEDLKETLAARASENSIYKLSKSELADYEAHKDDMEYLEARFGYIMGIGSKKSGKKAANQLLEQRLNDEAKAQYLLEKRRVEEEAAKSGEELLNNVDQLPKVLTPEERKENERRENLRKLNQREIESGTKIFKDHYESSDEWGAPGPGDSHERTKLNGDGDLIKFRWNGKTWEHDMRDATTKEEVNDEQIIEEEQKKTGGILTSIRDKITGLFGDGKEEDGEKKDSIFSKLFGSLEGGGLLGALSSLFGGLGTKLTNLLGKGGILGGLAGIAGNLVTGSLLTSIAMDIAKGLGAGDDTVDSIKQHGSVLTGASVMAKVPVIGPMVAGSMVAADALTGFAASSHDELDFDLGASAETDNVVKESKDEETSTVKIKSSNGETKSYKMVFASMAEFISYCQSNPDAIKLFKRTPEDLKVAIKDSSSNENLGVANGYTLLIPSKLCTDLHYASCVFRQNKCFYFVTKDSDAFKYFTPYADTTGFLQRNVLINIVVHTSDGKIITGSTFGSTTAFNYMGDNTVWCHSYMKIDPKTGECTKTDYTKENVLYYILESGGFTKSTLEERYNVGPWNIMRGITRDLGTMNGYFKREEGYTMGGPITYIDPITGDTITGDDIANKIKQNAGDNKTNAVEEDKDLSKAENAILKEGANVDYSGSYSDIEVDFVDPNNKTTNYGAWIDDATTRLRAAQAAGDADEVAKIKGEIAYIQEKYDQEQANQGKGSGLKGKGSGILHNKAGLRKFGKGFISQLDSKYANKKYGTTNVADAGCAPAVASMAASALGKNLSMGSAMSIGNKYATSEGTDSDYFGDALASKGISTSYIGANSAIDSLRSGKPVIMLGQDSYNTSKSNSPFGPNPHYVLGRGMDRQGNVIVDDPEMSGPTKYKPGILGSLKAAIGAGRGSGLFGKGSYERSTTKDQVYTWLVSNGYSPAAAAGVMGNIQQETGFKYGADSYDGHYPSIGMFQWEKYTGSDSTATSRAKALINFAAQNGSSWQDIGIQLAYMNKELDGLSNWFDPKNSTDHDTRVAALGGTFKNGSKKAQKDSTFYRSGLTDKDGVSIGQFKTLSDPQLAAKYFHAGFERSGDTWGSSGMNTRINAAQAYYDLYANNGQLNSTASTISGAINSNYTSSFKTTGSNREVVECNQNGDGTYVVVIKNKRTGKTETKLLDHAVPKGMIKIESAEFDQTKGKYKLTYSDGTIGYCAQKSGITSVTFDHPNGKYLIKYADGSSEYSSVKPSSSDYPSSLGTFNVNDGINYSSLPYIGSGYEETQNKTPIQKIMEIFSTAFNTALSGGNIGEALSGLSRYSTSSYGSTDTAHTGSGRQFGDTVNTSGNYAKYASYVPSGSIQENIKNMLQYATDIENSETYSQDGSKRTKEGQYSDCSAFASRAYKKFLGVDIGGDTDTQLSRLKAEKTPGVHLINHSVGDRSAYLNSNPQPGDLLYFRTKGHRGGSNDDVSHVEIYYGNNKIVGQNAAGPKKEGEVKGTGPTIKDFSSSMYSTKNGERYDRFIGAARYTGTGSGLMDKEKSELYNKYLGFSSYSGTGSGLSDSSYDNLVGTRVSSSPTRYTSHKTNNIILAGKGSKSDGLLEQLVGAILEILTKMIDNSSETTSNVAAIKANSDNLAKLTDLMTQYKEAKKSSNSTVKSNNTEIDDSFRSVVNKMAALAK